MAADAASDHRSSEPAVVGRVAAIPASARLARAGLAALVAVEFLWESLLAPIAPGSRWLALKALPLAVLLPGTLAGRRRSRQWLALLLPWFAAEAIVRALTETGRHALVASVAFALATTTFVALLAWFRRERRGACGGRAADAGGRPGRAGPGG